MYCNPTFHPLYYAVTDALCEYLKCRILAASVATHYFGPTDSNPEPEFLSSDEEEDIESLKRCLNEAIKIISRLTRRNEKLEALFGMASEEDIPSNSQRNDSRHNYSFIDKGSPKNIHPRNTYSKHLNRRINFSQQQHIILRRNTS
ncbi:uncharacterized protein LOC119658199 [Hermetia illucens]|uniref:uncharacterized protein LOC119658199 n=1 Tax=Hermetia illucens TaxID=343691 RepID=UPI0018CC2874|nr:uncharacterized protein LOC119658199 [Hermetia illucens]